MYNEQLKTKKREMGTEILARRALSAPADEFSWHQSSKRGETHHLSGQQQR